MKPERQPPKDVLLDALLPPGDGPERMLRFVRRRKVTRQVRTGAAILAVIASCAWMAHHVHPPPATTNAPVPPAENSVRIKYITDEELFAKLKGRPYAIVGEGDHRTVLLLKETFTPSDSLWSG